MKLIAQLMKQKTSGQCPVYVVCYVDRVRCRFATGVDIHPNDFDKASGTVKSKTLENKEKNLFINNVKKRITEIEVRYRLKEKKLTAELLQNEFDLPDYQTSFYAFYEVEMNKRKGVLSASTFEKYEITLKKLKRFREQLNFSDLNVDFINAYKGYCKGLGNCQNSINANLKNIKTFTRLAYKADLAPFDLFGDVKISNIEPIRNFLTEPELNKLYSYYKLNRFHENEKDILRPFLFSCFCGLRFSDVKALKFNNIQDDFLRVKIIKTEYIDKEVKIPVCNMAMEMIDFKRKTKTVFSMYSEQYMNRRLKALCKASGINKDITFHCARHTFATMYLRNSHNDFKGLQKLLGHANVAETMKYIHVLDEDVVKNITGLNSVIKYKQAVLN
ncbi:MAG: site-specific integrase [Paludibacter sp.]